MAPARVASGGEVKETFRAVAGQLATAVSVVVTLVDGEPLATTAGSLVVASHDPPLVALFLVTGSRASEALARADLFTASVLGAKDHDLAQRYARPGRPGGWEGLANAPFTRRDPWPPVLTGAIGWLDCRVDQILTTGDHTCFVGAVLAAGRSPGADPLVYYRGRLHGLRPAIVSASSRASSSVDPLDSW